MPNSITVKTMISAPVSKVWQLYTEPEHIVRWNNASDDWHSPRAENDVRVGGKFNIRMEAKDGGAGFDFEGTYTDVKPNQFLSYTMSDGRDVSITLLDNSGTTSMTIVFDPENENPVDMQRDGWQAILDNFKKYVESS